jgi:hypothetical protein
MPEVFFSIRPKFLAFRQEILFNADVKLEMMLFASLLFFFYNIRIYRLHPRSNISFKTSYNI